MEFSDKFIAQAKRHDYPVAMLVIDLDHFKAINDNHGHAAGDEVLAQTGALLNRSFRDGDLVTRYGGEEFVVLMPHCDGENAMAKAEAVRLAIEELKPCGLPITTSIGVSSMEVGVDRDFEATFQCSHRDQSEIATEVLRRHIIGWPIGDLYDSPVANGDRP